MNAPRGEREVALNTRRLKSDAEGFSRLARLHSEIAGFADSAIHVDMSKVVWMDGHLASAFRIIARRAALANNKIRNSKLNRFEMDGRSNFARNREAYEGLRAVCA